MAISINGGGWEPRRRFHGASMLSEINVTPFVDVMLVLLIIFMITAHVMEFGIEVDVPKVRAVKDSAQELPVVNVTRDGNIFLNEKQVNIHEIATEVAKRFHNSRSVYLRADRETPWEVAVQVMSELGDANLTVNVVTQPEDSTNRRGR